MQVACPRCEIITDDENPLLPDGKHCWYCEHELTTTPRERAETELYGYDRFLQIL